MLLTGEPISAQEAYRRGACSRWFRAQLREKALELAAKIAGKSARAVQLAKWSLNGIEVLDRSRPTASSRASRSSSNTSSDSQEARDAFVESGTRASIAATTGRATEARPLVELTYTPASRRSAPRCAPGSRRMCRASRSRRSTPPRARSSTAPGRSSSMRPASRWCVARRVRRPRREPARVADLRGGVLPRRRAAAYQPNGIFLLVRRSWSTARGAEARFLRRSRPAKRYGRRAGASRTPAPTWRDRDHRAARRRPLRDPRPEDLGVARRVRGLALRALRTDPASERHHGLTFVLVPLDTPGVTCARSRSSTARPASPRCSSTTRASPSRTGSAGKGRAGASRCPRRASSAA